MAHYPQNASGLNYITYPIGPNPGGMAITAAGSTNTKGTYVEFVASTPFACNRVKITVLFTTSTAGRRYLLDLATGAGGAEVDILSNLIFESSPTAALPTAGVIELDLAIPAGTRIALRCQCSTASVGLNATVTLIAAGDTTSPTAYTTLGADTSDSGGTAIDPGGTANTKGAWVQLVASSAAVIQEIVLMASRGAAATSGGSASYFDIGIGGAGVEAVLIADIPIVCAEAGNVFSVIPRSASFLTYIAAGTRIAVRSSCSTNTAGNRVFDVTLLGATAPAETPSASYAFLTQSPSIVRSGGVAGY